ncbi:MAG: hypothetical protein ACM3KM_03195 [Acidobacteriaceae bacterium]
MDTQINQIYFLNPESGKNSLILYEEKIGNNRLFLLLELSAIKRKTEANELKKISEVILSCFRENQKLPVVSMFETTLSEINNKLAETAFKGTKTWIGKFSGLVMLITAKELFLANSGNTAAWIRRDSELSEIVGPDRKTDHPLKVFVNFLSGRISRGDQILITTSNLFDFVSVDLLSTMLQKKSLALVCEQASQIISDSADPDQAFGSFFLGMEDEPEKATPAVLPPVYNYTEPEMEPESVLPSQPPKSSRFGRFFSVLNLENYKLKKFNFHLPSFQGFPLMSRFKRSSIAEKFFLITAGVLVVVFLVNLAIWGSHSISNRRGTEKVKQSEKVTSILNAAESAIILKNDEEAAKLLSEGQTEINKLKDLDQAQGLDAQNRFETLFAKVNRVTVITQPTVVNDLKYSPSLIAKAGNGYLLSNADPDTLAFLEGQFKPLTMLNSTDGDIKGIAHIPGSGHWVLTKTTVYHVNESLKLFENVLELKDADLVGIKFLSPDRVYLADKKANQILKYTLKAGKLTKPQMLLKSPGTLDDINDFGMDTDVYLLTANGIKKFVSGKQQAFRTQTLIDPLSSASNLIVGNSLYVLEPAKKRLVQFSKKGDLINQIYFPNTKSLSGFYVDETARKIDLIDQNQLLEVTF